jgi:hypothetical protein
MNLKKLVLCYALQISKTFNKYDFNYLYSSL